MLPSNLRPWAERAILGLVCFALGVVLAPQPEPAPAIQAEQVADAAVEAKQEVQTVKAKTVKTTKPDGTVTEVHEDTYTVAKAEAKASDKTQTKASVTPAKPELARYSLELAYLPSLSAPPSYLDSRVDVGARLGNTSAWGTLGYDLKYRQLSFGIRYEW